MKRALTLAAIGFFLMGFKVVDSPYSAFTKRFAAQWPKQAESFKAPPEGALRLRCLKLDGPKDYVGLEQVMVVDAPLAAVAKVVEDVAGYKKLFPGLNRSDVKERDGDELLTSWEQNVPVFFIPNIKFSMVYWLGGGSGDAKVVRYQLHEKGPILANDGVIAMKATAGGKKTLYVAYDFVDTDPGAFGGLASGRIWKDTVKGIYATDFAIRFKAQSPGGDSEKLREKAEKQAERDEKLIEECVSNREALRSGGPSGT